RLNGLPLGYQDNVVNFGMRQQLRDDARSNAGNMAFARRPTEDGGAFGIDGDDPNVGIVLFEPTRHSSDRSRRADADEDIIKRVKIGADLSRRELVVRLDRGCLFADLTALGRPREDPVGGAVLDAPNRVDILEFGKEIHPLHRQLHMWRWS